MRLLNPDQLDEWIQQGIIEPANSPWASPLVPVKKKDGRTRWVTDLRQLHDVTIKDAYPLTNIQENLQKLKGAKIFTSIDACGAYHAIQIEEGSRECTAFISPFGTFRYIGMPFGLSNSGSVYTWTWPWHNYLWNTGSRIWTTFLYIPWTPRTTGSI